MLVGLQYSPDSPFLVIITVCFRCELGDSVERNPFVGRIDPRKIVEEGIAITSEVTMPFIHKASKNVAARTDIGKSPSQNKMCQGRSGEYHPLGVPTVTTSTFSCRPGSIITGSSRATTSRYGTIRPLHHDPKLPVNLLHLSPTAEQRTVILYR